MKKAFLKIFLVMMLSLFGVPLMANAAGETYEVGFKFYKLDTTKYASSDALIDAILDDQLEEITSSSLAPGDAFIVGAYVNTLDTATAKSVAFSMYFNYNTDLIEEYDSTKYAAFGITERERDGGAFSGRNWSVIASNVNGFVSGSFQDSNVVSPTAYAYSGTAKPILCTVLKVKDDASGTDNMNFTFVKKGDAGADPSKVTLFSDADKNEIPVAFHNATFTLPVVLSEDATLKSLVVKDSSGNPLTLTPGFSASDTSYTLTVPSTMESISIEAETNDSKASFLPGEVGTKNLNFGDNTFNITVTPEAGQAKTYTVVVKRPSNDVKLQSLTVKNGTTALSLNPAFNANNLTENASNPYLYEYTYIVTDNIPFATTSLNIEASVASVPDGATYGAAQIKSGTGTWNLTGTGTLTTKVVVEAENCTYDANDCTKAEYTIQVNRESANTDADLAKLNVQYTGVNKDYTSGFSTNSSSPVALDSVKNSVGSIKVTATPHDTKAKAIKINRTQVNGETTINLTNRDTTISVEVTAEDGTTTKTYYFKVTKQSNNADLATMTITGKKDDGTAVTGTLNPATFNPATTTYTYTYDESVKTITVAGTVSDTTYGATATGLKDYVIGTDTKADVVVTAEDGTTKTYTVNFTRKQSNDTTLSSLSVKDKNNKEYITTFDPATKEYTVELENDIDKVNISATATSSNFQKLEGPEDNVAVGFDTSVVKEIKVTAEDGSVTNPPYKITITRKKSTDANLTSLKINGTLVNASDFNPTTLEYTMDEVGKDVTSLTITDIKTSNGYATTAVSNTTLTAGQTNSVTVTVTPQSGANKVYKIKVYKKDNNTDLATLNVTSATGKTGTLTQDASTKKYTYTYAHEETAVNIAATVTGSGKTVSGDIGNGIGISNNVTKTVTVKAEDGTTFDYEIKFVQEVETNSALTSLSASDGTNEYISSFSDSNKTYTFTVGTEVDSLDLTAVVAGDYVKEVSATVNSNINVLTGTDKTYTHTASLNPGSNTIDIIVTAENDSSTTYTLNVTRTINTNASLTDLKIDGATITDFNSSKTSYELTYGFDKTSINIEATGATDTTVSGQTGSQNLTVGDNTFTINVKSNNSSAEVNYVVKVRRQSNDNSISSITSSSGEVKKELDGTYTLSVSDTVNTVDLTVNLTDSKAKVTAPASLNGIDVTSASPISLTVAAEDTTKTQNYTINVKRLASDKSLSALTVKVGETDYITDFSSTKTSYNISLPFGTTSVNLSATPKNSKATIDNSELGDKTVANGDKLEFTVTAEDKSTQKYTINVTVAAGNSDTSISSLTVAGKTATLKNNQYEVIVPTTQNTIASSDIVATLNGANATISKYDSTLTLVPGDNTYKFTVKAESGAEKEYPVKVIKAGNELTSLTSTVGTISPSLTSGTYKYDLTIPNGTTEFTINSETKGATVEASHTYQVSSLVNNKFTVVVTPVSGEEAKTYEINVKFESDSLATLGDIVVKSEDGTKTYALDKTFNSATKSYDIGEIPNDVTKLKIEVTNPNNASLKYQVNSETESTNNIVTLPTTLGAGTIKVLVTSKDGSKNETYTIAFEKVQNIPSEITSTVHTIDDDYIRTVKLNETALTLKNELTNDNQYLVIRDANDTRDIADGETLGTGMIVKLIVNGVEKDHKSIVIRGDTTGDGVANLADAVKDINHYLRKELLTGAYLIAGDIDGNSAVQLPDAVKIINHYLRKELIK